MSKNVINCIKSELVPGRMLRASAKTVNEAGVLVKMPGGHESGIISSRCWGNGPARAKALAAIRPGDEFDVVVRRFDARKSEKSHRARCMRERRLRAEAIRSCRHVIDHFAAKRREALNLIVCGERHERAHEHHKFLRTWRRGRWARAHAA